MGGENGYTYYLANYANSYDGFGWSRDIPVGVDSIKEVKDEAHEVTKGVIWANYEDYFFADPKTARPDLEVAIRAGATGIGAFFAAGVETDFQFIRLKTKGGKSCDLVSKKWEEPESFPSLRPATTNYYVRQTSADQFERIRFAQDAGVWSMIREDVSAEQAFALMVSDARLSNKPEEVPVIVSADVRCNMTKDARHNAWIENGEAYDLAYVVEYLVLPKIKDADERAALKNAVNGAIKKAGTLSDMPLAEVPADVSDKIREVTSKEVRKLEMEKAKLYLRLTELQETAVSIKMVGWLQLPPLSAISPLPDTSAEDMVTQIDQLMAYVKAKIPLAGDTFGVRKFLDEKIYPLRAEMNTWYRSYESADNLAAYLSGQTEGPIKIMAAGSSFERGGFLGSSGEVVLGIPTHATPSGADVDLDGLSGLDVSKGTELTSDWEALVRHFRAKGWMDFEEPARPFDKKVAELSFGGKKVPLKSVKGMDIYGRTPEALTALLNSSLETISKKAAPFGPKYLSALAGNGVAAVVLVPQKHLNQMMLANGSDLAMRAEKALKKGRINEAVSLLKEAVAYFIMKPSGVYERDQKTIFLSKDAVENFSDDELEKTFLHELGHADEHVRLAKGGLKDIDFINEHQNDFIKVDDNTVSQHPLVTAKTDSAAKERRADGYAHFMTDPMRLRSVDPDLYAYFSAVGMNFKEKTVEVEVQRSAWTAKEKVSYTLYRMDPASDLFKGGALLWWVASNAASDWIVPCMAEAGSTGQWADTSGGRCEFVAEEKKPVSSK